jgi:hypothetical protein
MKLTTDLNLVLRLRMVGAIPLLPLYAFIAWTETMLPFKILLRWARHVACMGEKMHAKFWWRNLKNSNHLEDLSIDWKLTIKWILKVYAGRA